jgi:hypothetical protein
MSPVELTDGGGWRGEGGGAKSYDSEKVSSSIDHSILSACHTLLQFFTFH